jgi:hypothetical protein
LPCHNLGMGIAAKTMAPRQRRLQYMDFHEV